MSYKILTKNGINNTNIDGARGEHFNAGMRSGIVKGALNEGNFASSSSNSIYLDTCELRICGHRIVIDAPIYKTLANTPATNIRYSFVAQIIIDENSNVTFSMFLQDIGQKLIQDNLYKTENGAGTYQLEIGRFTQQTDGTITDITRTADLITGGIGNNSSGTINIGNITTNTLDAGMEAFVDIEQRYDENDKKTYTDFNFDIPKGDKGNAATISIGVVNTVAPNINANVTNVGTENDAILDFDIPQGVQGIQGEKGDKGEIGATGAQGEKGDKGDTGATGNGITTITKTSSSGLIDTYTITFTNGNTTTFEIKNGNGIKSIIKTSTSGLVDTYTITYTDNSTGTFTVTNGAEIQLRVADGYFQIKYSNETEWQNILPVSALVNVDSELSMTSPNPVQNKTITSELNAKATNDALQKVINNETIISNQYGGVSAGVGATAIDAGIAIGKNTYAPKNAVAVGYSASAYTNNPEVTNSRGVAIGSGAKAEYEGVAIGLTSKSVYGGSAVGIRAVAGAGFSGGKEAKAYAFGNEIPIDTIQLGTGTNHKESSLQIYDDNIYDAHSHTATFQHLDVDNLGNGGITTQFDVNGVNISAKAQSSIGGSVLGLSENSAQITSSDVATSKYSSITILPDGIDFDTPSFQIKGITIPSLSEMTQLYSGNIYVNNTQNLSQPYTDFKFLVFEFISNANVVVQNAIPVELLKLWQSKNYNFLIIGTFNASNSYFFTLQMLSTTAIRCTQRSGTSNLAVYGLK